MENKLLTLDITHPKLALEWHYELNGDNKPYNVTCSNYKKVWWVCCRGHVWSAGISSRASKGRGCPYCSNQRVLEGYNDLVTTHPEVANEWNHDKNIGVKPHEVVYGSRKKYWWKCKHGHEWDATVAKRTKSGTGCPYCSGRKVMTGFNDIATTHPQLTNEWNYEKNNSIKPTEISRGSGKKVWWKCREGHEWNASVVNRAIHGRGCPYCANKRVLEGYNDLKTTHPLIASEWNYNKNRGIKPTEVVAGSNAKVWWICAKGHEYRTAINTRTSQGSGCSYCGGKKVAKGYNDLASKFPNVASEWHPTKNGSITPDKIQYGSDKKAWWKCRVCEYEWETPVNWRTTSGSGCPKCNNNQTSYPERLIYEFFKSRFPNTQHRLKVDGMEFDVVVPELRLFIEYDGAHWHGGASNIKHNESIKEIEVLKHGYYFLRIAEVSGGTREVIGGRNTERSYIIITPEIRRLKSLSDRLCRAVQKYVKEQFNISIEYTLTDNMRDEYLAKAKTTIKENNITVEYPHLMEEWHEDNKYNPLTLTKGSDVRIKWRCKKCGHIWETWLWNRTGLGSGCGMCARKRGGSQDH